MVPGTAGGRMSPLWLPVGRSERHHMPLIRRFQEIVSGSSIGADLPVASSVTVRINL